MKQMKWIISFHLIGFVTSVVIGFAFYYAFAYINSLGFPGYLAPYFVKRVALSVSACLATLQTYIDMLRYLFSRKSVVPPGQDDRRWLIKLMMKDGLTAEGVTNIKNAVTILPPWFKFVVLYLFAVVLALL